MKNLKRYVGKLVRLHPARFRSLLASVRRRGQALDNCFLIGAVSDTGRKLICYGFNQRLEVAPDDIVLV